MHIGEKCVKEYAMNSQDMLMTIRNSYETKGKKKNHTFNRFALYYNYRQRNSSTPHFVLCWYTSTF